MLRSSLKTSHPKNIQRRWCSLAKALWMNKTSQMIRRIEGCEDHNAVHTYILMRVGFKALDISVAANFGLNHFRIRVLSSLGNAALTWHMSKGTSSAFSYYNIARAQTLRWLQLKPATALASEIPASREEHPLAGVFFT